MGYVVLARRWRPQGFEEVVGQRHITKTLQNAISMDRLAHAYLFSGSRGIGKTTVARILAKALNCKEGPTPHPCGKCDSCVEIMSGVALDVQEIDGASNTGVDDVRELRDGLRYRPASSRYRIYIIDEVHMLSNAAFNALLKTLEEPPSHVVFIFATTEPHKIPVTILSRCQHFDFKRIPLVDIVAQLECITRAEGIEIGEEALALIAKEAQGSLRDAQSLLDQVIAYSGNEVEDEALREVLGMLDRRWLFQASEALVRRDPRACLEVVESLFQHGVSLTYFYHQFVEHIRNLTVVKMDLDPQALLRLPDHAVAELQEQSKSVSAEDLHFWFEILIGAEEQIRRSAYPRYLLELLLLKITQLDRTQDLQSLLDGIQGLTDRFNREKQPEQRKEETTSQSANRSQITTHMVSVQTWAEFLEYLRSRRQGLASVLEQGRFLGCSKDSEIKLAFPSAFHVEQVSARDYTSDLDALGSVFFGRSVKVTAVLDAKDSGCQANPVKKRKHQLQVGVKAHPLVREAIQVFGGRVVDVLLPEEHSSEGKGNAAETKREEVEL